MTPKTDPVAVLRVMRDFYAGTVLNHPEKVAALDAAIAALAAQGEVVAEVYAGAFGIHYIACADPNNLPVGTKLYLRPAPPGEDAVTEAEVDRVLEAYYAPHGLAQFDEVQLGCKRMAMTAALAALSAQASAPVSEGPFGAFYTCPKCAGVGVVPEQQASARGGEDAEVWNQAAADILGKTSNLYRLVRDRVEILIARRVLAARTGKGEADGR